jgi:hypothetical protein
MSGGRNDWTELMYRVLHGVKDDLGLWCECKEASHHDDQPGTVPGERLHIDFFWYHRAPGHEARAKLPEELYQPPCIVIEHENAGERLEYNLWKLSQLAAPLRILIGYADARGPRNVDGRKNELLHTAQSAGLFAPAGTEDLLLLSDDEPTDKFTAWWRPAGQSWLDSRLLDVPKRP